MYHFASSKKGETLISVLVGVVILAIAMGSVAIILVQNRTIEEDYDMNNQVFLLQSNTENMVKKLDTHALNEKDMFFLYKNPATKTIQVLTGTGNEMYKYIDKNGDLVVNTGSFAGSLYTRILYLEKKDISFGKESQVIKGGIKELIRK